MSQKKTLFVDDALIKQITGFIYSRTICKREIVRYSKPPTFIDWLFRRTQKFTFEFEIKDLIHENEAKQAENTLRIYEIK